MINRNGFLRENLSFRRVLGGFWWISRRLMRMMMIMIACNADDDDKNYLSMVIAVLDCGSEPQI